MGFWLGDGKSVDSIEDTKDFTRLTTDYLSPNHLLSDSCGVSTLFKRAKIGRLSQNPIEQNLTSDF